MPAKIVGMFDYCPELVKKKSSYTPAHGRATAKWMAKNREQVNKKQRENHAHKMRTDMDYRNKRAESLKKSNKIRRAKVEQYKAAFQLLEEIDAMEGEETI